jgi:hypothetical protein
MSRTLSLFLAFGMEPPRIADEKTPKTKQLKRRIFLTGNLNFFLSPSPASFYPQKHSNKRDGLLQLCCFSTQRATFFQRYAVYEERRDSFLWSRYFENSSSVERLGAAMTLGMVCSKPHAKEEVFPSSHQDS